MLLLVVLAQVCDVALCCAAPAIIAQTVCALAASRVLAPAG
jgi:hypothetical protein